MYVAKPKAQISCVVTAQLISASFCAYAKSSFSRDASQITVRWEEKQLCKLGWT